METLPRKRITSIDALRGLVMILMALDHVRDYFHYEAFLFDPTDLTQSTPAIFWTRFVTHFCAPVFVLLAGTSAFLVGKRRSKKELSIWLVKRGIWLIIAELTIIKLAWMFKLDYSNVVLQVIWVLGICMLVLSAYIYLPKKIGLTVALLFVLGHNLFDNVSFAQGSVESGIWAFFHQMNIVPIGASNIFIGYPFIPWVFVMPLGYYLGELYTTEFDAEKRQKLLFRLGFICIAVFIALRTFNLYGDPLLWSQLYSLGLTIASFFNVSKYPPSLLYLCITLGPSFIFLALAERWSSPLKEKLVVIGRVPMFYYIIHLYVIHAIAMIAAISTGFKASDMVIDLWVTLSQELQGYGFSLPIVYVVWIIVVIGLYPICAWYNNYKSNNRDKWWLSYL
ncbi:MAG: heparan-alpha-glucosaminide N-acetyltransferase domain-containing protein [Schleiferiaceae bacterium]|nr:heparan-alpha-glucosaminide N-acetyltransferase domain-containing protein [Schleiferiaceae bacterium]